MKRIVSIKWRDSRQIHGWTLMDDIDKESCEISSVGYLIAETERDYTLALSVSDMPKQANAINIIPKCSVIEFVDLNEDRMSIEELRQYADTMYKTATSVSVENRTNAGWYKAGVMDCYRQIKGEKLNELLEARE